MNNTPNVNVQIPILGILGIVFITLKLTGHIAWSWWWVLAPFWIPLALAAVIFVVALIFAFFFDR